MFYSRNKFKLYKTRSNLVANIQLTSYSYS